MKMGPSSFYRKWSAGILVERTTYSAYYSMNRKLKLVSLIFFFVSCQPQEQHNNQNVRAFNNSSTIDTLGENTATDINNLKSNDENCPISVISASAKVDKYGFGKIYIKFKNTSSKTIDAIQISYKKYNAFKEPLGQTYYNEFSKKMETNNSGAATITTLVNAGKTVTEVIEIDGQNSSFSKVVAKASKVSFKDGSVWKSSEILLLNSLSGKNSQLNEL